MTPSTTTSAFLPWIIQPQATRPAASTSPIHHYPQRPLSDDDLARLPPLFDKVAVPSPSFYNVPRNSFPDTRFLLPTSGSHSSKDPHDDLYTDDPLIALRPIIQDHHRPSVDQQQQLPPIQDVIIDDLYQIHSSPPLSCVSPSSRSNSLSSWSPRSFDSSSRKGSIASLLNSDSESRQPTTDQGRDVPMVAMTTPTTPVPTRRGRPRATKRKRNDDTHDEEDDDEEEEQQKKRGMTKGLRHFSKLVSDKVAERGVTTYNQVADELAAEIRSNKKMTSTAQSGFDQKNIRRRVYDALNVLMAMDIIAKDKKEIRWLGIPSCFHNNDDDNASDRQRQQQQQIEKKIKQEEERHQQLAEQVQQAHLAITDKLNEYLRLRDLVSRNEKRPVSHDQLVELPFHVVRCNQDAVVDVAPDGREAVIVSTTNDDSRTSSVHSDRDILQTLGYGAHQNSYLPDPSWYPFLCPPHSHTVRATAS